MLEIYVQELTAAAIHLRFEPQALERMKKLAALMPHLIQRFQM